MDLVNSSISSLFLVFISSVLGRGQRVSGSVRLLPLLLGMERTSLIFSPSVDNSSSVHSSDVSVSEPVNSRTEWVFQCSCLFQVYGGGGWGFHSVCVFIWAAGLYEQQNTAHKSCFHWNLNLIFLQSLTWYNSKQEQWPLSVFINVFTMEFTV